MYQPPGMLQMSHHHLVKKQGRITLLHIILVHSQTLHSTSAKIKALEEKLKMMEAENDQIVDHQSSSTQHASSSVIHRTRKYSKPYHRPQHINR